MPMCDQLLAEAALQVTPFSCEPHNCAIAPRTADCLGLQWEVKGRSRGLLPKGSS
jgi:hypothetical protein